MSSKVGLTSTANVPFFNGVTLIAATCGYWREARGFRAAGSLHPDAKSLRARPWARRNAATSTY